MSKMTKTIAALGVVAGLGVAALPLSSYAAQSQPVTLTAVIDSNISITAEDTEVSVGTVMVGGEVAKASTDVTVTTNSATGYTLQIKDEDANTNMTNNANLDAVIPAGSPAKGTSAWGVSVDDGAEWKAVTADGIELAKSSTAASEDDLFTGTTTVTFGVSAATGQASGTYKDTVVFVATTNVE